MQTRAWCLHMLGLHHIQVVDHIKNCNTNLKSAGSYFGLSQEYMHCFIVIATLLPHTAIVYPSKCADFKFFHWTDR